ncbi:MAG: PIN domain nuclease [bacterium]|jgi:predicted nucleic acid-binding protein|nr:PIN domain nuclease [bacterium]
MILVDTSAWIEFLRSTNSPAHRRVRSSLANREPLATTEVVAMEVFAGASDAAHLQRLRRLLFGCRLLSLRGLADYEDAAALHRACRARGVTVRRLTDCLIATVALRWGVPVLHADRDFDRIAECTSLQIERA